MKTFLFQGDSITDVGRDRAPETQSLGHGYATVVSAMMHNTYPGEFQFINRGISGNRSVDLYARIKADVINLKPDYLSVLVGVNDVWHEFNFQNGICAEKYEQLYSMFIEEVKEELPDITIILLEPFITDGEVLKQHGAAFRAEVEKRADAVKRIAQKYDLTFVPLQKKFDEMAKAYGEAYVTWEGVHPTLAGHGLIAKELMDAIERLI